MFFWNAILKYLWNFSRKTHSVIILTQILPLDMFDVSFSFEFFPLRSSTIIFYSRSCVLFQTCHNFLSFPDSPIASMQNASLFQCHLTFSNQTLSHSPIFLQNSRLPTTLCGLNNISSTIDWVFCSPQPNAVSRHPKSSLQNTKRVSNVFTKLVLTILET